MGLGRRSFSHWFPVFSAVCLFLKGPPCCPGGHRAALPGWGLRDTGGEVPGRAGHAWGQAPGPNCCRSVAQSCQTLCDPMDCSTPDFPVHHQLPEPAQTHVYRVNDAIQPSCPVIPFFSCLQSFPASGNFPMSQLFVPGGQSIRASSSASVSPSNESTGLISFRIHWVSASSELGLLTQPPSFSSWEAKSITLLPCQSLPAPNTRLFP